MTLRTILLAAVVSQLGCQSATLADTPCPSEGTALTYRNFGEPFFNAYCNECHGGRDGYSSRAFPTVTRIREDRERIFATAAANNVSMPPGPDDPPATERERLAEWLACGAP